MMYNIKGKWSLITGAARGIGYLTACMANEDNVKHGQHLPLF
jgi:short-subunit dehydrogenase